MINVLWLLGIGFVATSMSFIILFLVGLNNDELDASAGGIFTLMIVALFAIIITGFLYVYSYFFTLPILIPLITFFSFVTVSLLIFVEKFNMSKDVNICASFLVITVSYVISLFIYNPSFNNNQEAENFINTAISSKLTLNERQVYNYRNLNPAKYWTTAFFCARYCQDNPESKECEFWINAIVDEAKLKVASMVERKKQKTIEAERFQKAAEKYKVENK